MNKTEFKRLLEKKENVDLDFKTELPDSENTARTIAAFYNSKGGKIVLGVDDKKKLTTKGYIELTNTSLITAKRDLLDLKKKKIIRFTGPAKIGYYCLCDTANDTAKNE